MPPALTHTERRGVRPAHRASPEGLYHRLRIDLDGCATPGRNVLLRPVKKSWPPRRFETKSGLGKASTAGSGRATHPAGMPGWTDNTHRATRTGPHAPLRSSSRAPAAAGLTPWGHAVMWSAECISNGAPLDGLHARMRYRPLRAHNLHRVSHHLARLPLEALCPPFRGRVVAVITRC